MIKNIPNVKMGIIAVSRSCFPKALSERRRKAVVGAYGKELYECPVTVENEIDAQGMYHTRYYSGKSLRTLGVNEQRLNDNGQFRTWSNVIGATRSTHDANVIRTDFFQYINSIARPIKARMQYNSWYDWMMNITEERINSSFEKM